VLPDGKNDNVIYGIFTTPDNSIAGSAVCKFRLSDIRSSLEEGPFKGQSTASANWLPVRELPTTPEGHRPGSCKGDSTSLNERALNFLKEHSLMDRPVGTGIPPLFVKASMKERFTVIAADPNVNGRDVIFVGTTRGKVVKFVQSEEGPIVIEEMQVFPYHVPVANLRVIRDRLVVLSDHEVKSLPLARCRARQVQTCDACVGLQDPYCSWSLTTASCVDSSAITVGSVDAVSLIQDVDTGAHVACADADLPQDNGRFTNSSKDSSQFVFICRN